VVEISDRIDPKKFSLSQKGIDFLKEYESEVKEDGKHILYNDDAEYCTIGYGHLVDGKITCKNISREKYEKFKNGLSDKEANDLFKKDIVIYEDIIKRNVKVNLYQYEFDALVIFVFNLGEPNLRKSELLKKVNERKYEDTPPLFSRFIKSGGVVMRGLVSRRNAEAKIFKDNIYDSKH
jgi:GH24 family phage-related lysozyme (muramidase)